uniref:Uncharacterized protein n=1 Tax=Rhizophora mucronata TaxID=61149 RepID=A0A2P2N6R2_RHIMU
MHALSISFSPTRYSYTAIQKCKHTYVVINKRIRVEMSVFLHLNIISSEATTSFVRP